MVSVDAFALSPHLIDDVLDFPPADIREDDDLSLDPDYPPQSFAEWEKEPMRRRVSRGRHTLYVVPLGWPVASEKTAAATATHGADGVVLLSKPSSRDETEGVPQPPSTAGIPFPRISDIAEYVAAFFYGMPLKLLPVLPLVPWASAASGRGSTGNATSSAAAVGSKRKRAPLSGSPPVYTAVRTPTAEVRIRCRPAPDGAFPVQLNLDDCLDAVAAALPSDGYAIIGITPHDLYEAHADGLPGCYDAEDPEADLFTCGRAYGGSRIAVVSAARYCPAMDAAAGVREDCSWPAAPPLPLASQPGGKGKRGSSRPAAAVGGAGAASSGGGAAAAASGSADPRPALAPGVPHAVAEASLAAFLRAAAGPSAAAAALRLSSAHVSASDQCGMWTARMCRTAAHELCHCLGMDHCVYGACSMQGAASVGEDLRQPPFLCPVDLRKLLAATGTARQHSVAATVAASASSSSFASAAGAYTSRGASCSKRRRIHSLLAEPAQAEAGISPAMVTAARGSPAGSAAASGGPARSTDSDGAGIAGLSVAAAVERYEALHAFCARPAHARVPLFVAFAAWLRQRISRLRASEAAGAADAAAGPG